MKRRFRLTRSIDLKRVRSSGKSYAHPLIVLIVGPAAQEGGARLPAVAAGLATTHWGLRDTASAYAVILVLLALVAAALTARTPLASRANSQAR